VADWQADRHVCFVFSEAITEFQVLEMGNILALRLPERQVWVRVEMGDANNQTKYYTSDRLAARCDMWQPSSQKLSYFLSTIVSPQYKWMLSLCVGECHWECPYLSFCQSWWW